MTLAEVVVGGMLSRVISWIRLISRFPGGRRALPSVFWAQVGNDVTVTASCGEGELIARWRASRWIYEHLAEGACRGALGRWRS